jgi:hypothetical protein
MILAAQFFVIVRAAVIFWLSRKSMTEETVVASER